MQRLGRHWRTLLAIVSIIGLWSGMAFSAAPTSLTAQTPALQPKTSKIIRIRAATKADQLALISRGVDLLEERDGKDLFALVTEDQIAKLRDAGFTLSVDQEQTRLLSSGPALNPVQGGYRTVEEGFALLDAWQTNYPNLAQTFTYGMSWDKFSAGGPAGYDLRGITLTNKLIAGPKPTFFLMSAIHAREMSTAELTLRFIDYLLSNYATNPDVHWLLDEHMVVVVPFVNPDGRKIAEGGSSFPQRKNRDTAATPSCSGTVIGVDLNRNSTFKWGTVDSPSDPPCGETWPGPSPASEPEIYGLQNWVSHVFPDQRGPADQDPAPDDATGVFLTLHSFSDLVLWPYGHDANVYAPNDADLRGLGKKFASYNGFTPQKSTDLYPTSGTTDDWAYGTMGVAAYTFEVGGSSGTCGGFFPAFTCLDSGPNGNFWGRNLPAFLYAAKVARTPYLLQRGPDALSVSSFSTSTDYQVRATINDTTNGNQALAAAEMYLDTPPWRSGTPVAMTASDGSFNGTVEAVQGSIAGPLSNGRHLVYVRGRDAANNWGPITATWLDVAPNGISGVVTTADNGQPAPGVTVTATTGAYTSTSVTAADGSYRLELPTGTYSVTAGGAGFTTTAPSNQAVSSNAFTAYNISIVEKARLTTAPSAFVINAPTNSVLTRTLTVGNAGGEALNAAISLAPAGYEVASSDDAGGPAYSWVEVNAVGTRRALGDDACTVVTLPQAVTFYGTSYTQIGVHSNGYVTFGSGGCPGGNNDGAANGTIPAAAAPNATVAALWDDMDPTGLSGTNGIFTHHDAANGRFVIEYSGVPHYNDNGAVNPETFEILIDLGSNDVTLQYKTIVAGGSATVGIENSSGSEGLQWAYNQDGRVRNSFALRYAAYGTGAWLTWTPSNPGVAARSASAVTLTANSTGLAAGQYRVRLRVNASGATNGDQYVPVTLNVGATAGVNLSGASAMNGAPGGSVTYTLTLTNEGPATDTFNLALSGQTWTSALGQNSVTVASGQSTSVTVRVDIPNNATNGATDNVTLTATSQTSGSATDSVALTTTAQQTTYAVALAGANALSGAPSTSVTYTLTVANQGNATDTFSLALSGQTWTSALGQSSVTLGAGQSASVTVRVDIPNSAAENDSDAVTLTATSQGSGSATDSITLTTTAQANPPAQAIYFPLIVR